MHSDFACETPQKFRQKQDGTHAEASDKNQKKLITKNPTSACMHIVFDFETEDGARETPLSRSYLQFNRDV